jgi:glutaredoxin
MHGEQELKGDTISVCAMKYMPDNYFELLYCMAKEFRKIPDNLDSCASGLKMDVAKIKACADGEEGAKLIEESYKASKAKGASGSPTIYLNDEPYRGGRGGNDFLRALCEKYTVKPKACSEIPEPVKVKVTMITDKRCPQCQAERLAQNLKGVFPGLEAEILDYMDEKGKAEYQKFAEKGHKLLPIVAFGADAEKDEGYAKIQKWIQKVDNKLLLRTGAKFDPTREICDNQIDDTGNGKIDCDDDDCKDELVCRKEIKKKLDVFVMSQCPYGTMALDAMEEILEMFKEDKIDFNINFIATETEPGKFQALHGQPEVDENIRELCAIKHYPKNYMDYILCRNKNIRSNEWKECAKGKIKADVMEKCFTGGEGVKLHSENIKIANSMGIGGSPTWIINNKHKASGVSAADVHRNLCAHNAELKGCKKQVKPQAKPAPKGGCGS